MYNELALIGICDWSYYVEWCENYKPLYQYQDSGTFHSERDVCVRVCVNHCHCWAFIMSIMFIGHTSQVQSMSLNGGTIHTCGLDDTVRAVDASSSSYK